MARAKTGPKALKISKEIQDKICQKLEVGAAIELACFACGISRSTFYAWIKKGREGKEPEFVEFLMAVEHANAMFEVSAVKQINEAGEKDWRALAWLLERKFPSRWGFARRYDRDFAAIEREKLELQKIRGEFNEEDNKPTIINNVPQVAEGDFKNE